MRIVNRVSFWVCLFLSFNSYSDATGAGDAAIYAEMVKMVKTAREELEKIRELTSLQEQLKDMKQSELVKEISQAGRDFNQMFNDMERIGNLADEFKNDPYGTKQIERDLESLNSRLNRADDKSGIDKGRAYASIMRSMKNISWLGKIVRDNKKKVGDGVNNTDAQKMTAENTLIMTELLVSEQEKRVKREAINTMVVEDLMDGVSYSNMGLIPSKEK